MFNSIQGGFLGNAGAVSPDSLLAGSPGYFSERGVNDALYRYGMENTEKGRKIQENIQRIREKIPTRFGGLQATGGYVPGLSATNEALTRMIPPVGFPAGNDVSEQLRSSATNEALTRMMLPSRKAMGNTSTPQPRMSATNDALSRLMPYSAAASGFDNKRVS
jgi:hypothetical protein